MKILFAAALALTMIVPAFAPASAQDVGVRVGPGGAGVEVRTGDRNRGGEFRDRGRSRIEVRERSPRRVIVERRVRSECRTVVVRSRQGGETIIRRIRRCG
jgi:hypothetical protein